MRFGKPTGEQPKNCGPKSRHIQMVCQLGFSQGNSATTRRWIWDDMGVRQIGGPPPKKTHNNKSPKEHPKKTPPHVFQTSYVPTHETGP